VVEEYCQRIPVARGTIDFCSLTSLGATTSEIASSSVAFPIITEFASRWESTA